MSSKGSTWSGCKFRVLRLEIQPVDFGQQTSGCFQFSLHKRFIKDPFGPIIRDLGLPPTLNLALHRLEVPLDPIHANRQSIDQVKALAVLGVNTPGITSPNSGCLGGSTSSNRTYGPEPCRQLRFICSRVLPSFDSSNCAAYHLIT
jgi:hypothetical protein